MLSRKCKVSSDLERELDYLLAEEKEERGERRGLEQRAAALVAALLIAFPISATVARETHTERPLAVAALSLLVFVLLVAVAQAAFLTAALGEPKRERFVVRTARQGVARALHTGDLATAVREQSRIVATIRNDNGKLVREVRKVTALLPFTLAGLLLSLALLVLADHTPKSSAKAPGSMSRLAGHRPATSSR